MTFTDRNGVSMCEQDPLPVFGFALSGNRSDSPHTVADDA